MHIKITTMLQSIYLVWEPLRTRYTGSNTNITASITQNIQNSTDVALWVCYNCLKPTAKRYSPNTRTTQMNPRAPVPTEWSFLASFLNSCSQLVLLGATMNLNMSSCMHHLPTSCKIMVAALFKP